MHFSNDKTIRIQCRYVTFRHLSFSCHEPRALVRLCHECVLLTLLEVDRFNTAQAFGFTILWFTSRVLFSDQLFPTVTVQGETVWQFHSHSRTVIRSLHPVLVTVF